MPNLEKRPTELSQPEIEKALQAACLPFGGLRKVSLTVDKHGDPTCYIELNDPVQLTRLYSVLPGTVFADWFVVTLNGRARETLSGLLNR